MSRTVADDLIERIWDVEDSLKALLKSLKALEFAIADTVPDDE